MISLGAIIVRRRIYYPRPIAGLPDILMIEMVAEFRRGNLPLGRFYPILVETAEEQQEVEDYLNEPREHVGPPDLLDARPATLPADHITIAHYGPSTDGWPFVLLCRWPADLAATWPEYLRIFARGVYTFELFRERRQLERASDNLLFGLKQRRPCFNIEVIPPEWLPQEGRPH
jgi:hypothetical protein